MNNFINAVELAKAYRLINHGPVTLVSARHNDTENVMAASWVCALDYEPARLTVVLDKMAYTPESIVCDTGASGVAGDAGSSPRFAHPLQ